MKTSKPIGSISYNSDVFLLQTLERLVSAHVLSFYMAVCHMAEDDEAGKKDHWHIYLEPSKSLQTDDLKLEFTEPDPDPSKPPLGILPLRSSKVSDWLLYALHDRDYCVAKHLTKKYVYTLDDVKSNDLNEVHRLFYMIDRTALTPWSAMKDAQKSGVDWIEFCTSGHVPVPQIHSYHEAWSALKSMSDSAPKFFAPGADPERKWQIVDFGGRKIAVSPEGEVYDYNP